MLLAGRQPPQPTPTAFAAQPTAAVALPLVRTPSKPVEYTYSFTIDRSAVPALYYDELSYVVDLGAASAVSATVGGAAVPGRYDSRSGTFVFTTDRAGAAVIRYTSQNRPDVTVQKASLKDNKAWAWSHGMDDNTMLQAQIAAISARGWRASLMLIGKDIDDRRDEDWILDKPALRRLLAQGWSLANHSWDHNCSPGSAAAMNATIVSGQNKLLEIVATSSVPDYKVITFAAPCFIADYDPYVEAMRRSGATTLLFNESQGNPLMNVDGADYSQGDLTASAMSSQVAKIGRGTVIESSPSAAIAALDWMAANKSATRHFWYNTLTHGSQEQNLLRVLSHAYGAYGPGGTNELWMAPSDEIYSYLVVRDRTVLR